jgi:hypothetical protein
VTHQNRAATEDREEFPIACACFGPGPGETMCRCQRAAWESGNPWPRDREEYERQKSEMKEEEK